MCVTSRASEPVTFYWQGSHFNGHLERRGRRRYLLTGDSVQLPLDGTPITIRFTRRPEETMTVMMCRVVNHTGHGIIRLRVRSLGERIQAGVEHDRVWGRHPKDWSRAS